MTHDNGGSAFPKPPRMIEPVGTGGNAFLSGGKDSDLSVHDYFMAKVAQGLTANPNYFAMNAEEVASCASKLATAMIAEKRRLEKEEK